MKNQKETEFKVPNKKQPLFNFVKKLLRLLYRRPRIVNLVGELPERCIFASNHVGKSGPMVYELYFPCYHAKWGAAEMLGNYASRKAYLRDVYYIKKNGYSYAKASAKAGFEALFSIYFYRGMKLIGTHTDGRLLNCINNTIKVLNADIPVMIYPENSNEGYKDVITQFFPGFVMLATQYYKRTGIDLPIYPVYYHQKKRLIVIDTPEYTQDYIAKGLNREEIAEHFRERVNQLYYRCEEGLYDLPTK